MSKNDNSATNHSLNQKLKFIYTKNEYTKIKQKH